MHRCNPSRLNFSRRQALAHGLALAVAGLHSGVALAEGAADGAAARAFISGKLEALRTELRKPKSAERDRQLTLEFDAMLDYDYFTRRTLGDHYQTLNQSQIEEFSGVLRKLFQKAYTEKLKDPDRYQIEYTGEAQAKDGTLVQTTIKDKSSSDKPLPVAYVVAKVGETWRARDIVTDTISLATNYRRQFGRLLKKENGFRTLMDKMNKKLAEG